MKERREERGPAYLVHEGPFAATSAKEKLSEGDVREIAGVGKKGLPTERRHRLASKKNAYHPVLQEKEVLQEKADKKKLGGEEQRWRRFALLLAKNSSVKLAFWGRSYGGRNASREKRSQGERKLLSHAAKRQRRLRSDEKQRERGAD